MGREMTPRVNHRPPTFRTNRIRHSNQSEEKHSKQSERMANAGLSFDHSEVLKRLSAKTKLDPETGCIEWQGRKNNDGYGLISIDGKTQRVHRVTWMLKHREPLTRHDHICHRCDNPSCVNPDHLFRADNQTNRVDYAMKVALPDRHLGPGGGIDVSKLPTDKVLAIRAAYSRREALTVIARQHSVTPSEVMEIVEKEDWPWLV